MKRIDSICYALIGSALLLGGLHITHTDLLTPNEAQAEMVVTKGELTVLSGEINQDREVIYMLDNRTGGQTNLVGEPSNVDPRGAFKNHLG